MELIVAARVVHECNDRPGCRLRMDRPPVPAKDLSREGTSSGGGKVPNTSCLDHHFELAWRKSSLWRRHDRSGLPCCGVRPSETNNDSSMRWITRLVRR